MVVRLQTAEGKIKEYETVEIIGGGDYPIEKYVSKCGIEWKNKPKQNEECNHLDCAIYLAEKNKKHGLVIFMIFITFAAIMLILFGFERQEFYLMLSGFYTLAAFAFLIWEIRAIRQFKNLTEYQDKSTINGIKATQISEDQEGTKAKHWWQFWR